ncbi:hypothetical protein B0H13DRAFT_1920959 [Mycena leptocephala]|nr:hypothetical protein B0H13DRAFT_1920959 [Mycena leptocephala]
MYLHDEHFYNVYIHVPVGNVVYSFHARFLGQLHIPPDVSFHPGASRDASIVITAGQGCSFFMETGGHRAYWLLVPPFTSRESEKAVRWSTPSRSNYNWPYSEHHEQDVYDIQEGDILCTAHLERLDRRFDPPRFEYVLHRIFSDAPIRRGSFLVSPAAWKGRARVRERVSEDIVTSCLECVLPSGRTIWVRALNRTVHINVGVLGGIGRTLARKMAEEEWNKRRTVRDNREIRRTPSNVGVTRRLDTDREILPRLPDLRFDYQGHLLLEVVAADYVQLSDGFTVLRYAVTEPSSNEFIKRRDSGLVVGMLHQVVRFVRNHGSTIDRPRCTVVECVVESEAVSSTTVLLVPNGAVHPSFTVDDSPNQIFTGAVEGSRVVELTHLDDVGHVSGFSAMYYRRAIDSDTERI